VLESSIRGRGPKESTAELKAAKSKAEDAGPLTFSYLIEAETE
jgi:hypothetical protein